MAATLTAPCVGADCLGAHRADGCWLFRWQQRFPKHKVTWIRAGLPLPIGSMYGIFTYIWLIFMVNVGKYSIHGSYGLRKVDCYISW